MKIIAGLGNPGPKYETTRHNVGFIVVDLIGDALNCDLDERAFGGLCGRCRYQDERLILVKPQTFMNRSGECVGRLANYFKVAHEDILVIADDLDQPVGALKMRERGSSGGHNGLKSIIAALGSDDFPRLKIGIGNGPYGAVDHVLGAFDDAEFEIVAPLLTAARDAALHWCREGAQATMNKYNRRPKKAGPAVEHDDDPNRFTEEAADS